MTTAEILERSSQSSDSTDNNVAAKAAAQSLSSYAGQAEFQSAVAAQTIDTSTLPTYKMPSDATSGSTNQSAEASSVSPQKPITATPLTELSATSSGADVNQMWNNTVTLPQLTTTDNPASPTRTPISSSDNPITNPNNSDVNTSSPLNKGIFAAGIDHGFNGTPYTADLFELPLTGQPLEQQAQADLNQAQAGLKDTAAEPYFQDHNLTTDPQYISGSDAVSLAGAELKLGQDQVAGNQQGVQQDTAAVNSAAQAVANDANEWNFVDFHASSGNTAPNDGLVTPSGTASATASESSANNTSAIGKAHVSQQDLIDDEGSGGGGDAGGDGGGFSIAIGSSGGTGGDSGSGGSGSSGGTGGDSGSSSGTAGDSGSGGSGSSGGTGGDSGSSGSGSSGGTAGDSGSSGSGSSGGTAGDSGSSGSGSSGGTGGDSGSSGGTAGDSGSGGSGSSGGTAGDSGSSGNGSSGGGTAGDSGSGTSGSGTGSDSGNGSSGDATNGGTVTSPASGTGGDYWDLTPSQADETLKDIQNEGTSNDDSETQFQKDTQILGLPPTATSDQVLDAVLSLQIIADGDAAFANLRK
ncbi:MAG TPA: hypothetical protein V6C81_20500 [Planktothrix sp.]